MDLRRNEWCEVLKISLFFYCFGSSFLRRLLLLLAAAGLVLLYVILRLRRKNPHSSIELFRCLKKWMRSNSWLRMESCMQGGLNPKMGTKEVWLWFHI